MSVPQFSRPGAVDLSSLRTPSTTQPGAPGVGPGGASSAGSGRYVIAVGDEQSLRADVVERSMSVVVLVSFWSPESPASVEINASLSRLADEFEGRFLLATVDVNSHPELAQALGIPEVPLVVAALRGQLAPLIQDPLPDDQLRGLVNQILQAAVTNGVTGRVDPADLGVPAWLSMTCAGGRTRAGESAEEGFAMAGGVDAVVAVGINCVDSVEASDLVTAAVESSDKPAVVYPNSGESWNAVDRTWAGTATFGPEHAAVWVAAGARLVGGCCRVGPSAIRALARSAPGWPVGEPGSVSSR